METTKDFDQLFAEAETYNLNKVGEVLNNMNAKAEIEDVEQESSNIVDVDFTEAEIENETLSKNKTTAKKVDFKAIFTEKEDDKEPEKEDEKDYTKDVISNWCESTVAILNLAIPKGTEYIGKRYLRKNVNSKNIELSRTEEKKLAKSLEPLAQWTLDNIGEVHPLVAGIIAILSAFGFSIITELSTAESLDNVENENSTKSENTTGKRPRGRPRKVKISEAV